MLRRASLPRSRTVLATLAALVAAPVGASASQVLALDIPDLTRAADQVVVAEVLSSTSAWDGERRRIVTTVELNVAEAWKGAVPGDGRLRIVQPGGTVDGVEMRVHGIPAFSAGERAVVFLRGGKASTIVGLAQGKRPLRWSAAAKQWMVEVPDLSDLSTVTPGGEPSNLRPVALPLNELRRRVRQAIGK